MARGVEDLSNVDELLAYPRCCSETGVEKKLYASVRGLSDKVTTINIKVRNSNMDFTSYQIIGAALDLAKDSVTQTLLAVRKFVSGKFAFENWEPEEYFSRTLLAIFSVSF